MTFMTTIARGLVAAAVAGLAVAVPAPSASATGCSIYGFTPREVVIGLSPVQRTFNVSDSCGGGQFSGWSIDLPNSFLYVYDSAPTDVFYVPYDNSEEGPYDAVVEAYGYDANDNYLTATRIFYDGFRYKRRTQINSFDASPEPVSYGSSITLRGKLFRANWTTERYDALPGRSVAVQFRTNTGSYYTVKNVTTDRYGWVNTRVTATRSGVWRLKYAGSGVSGAYTTAGDAVSLR